MRQWFYLCFGAIGTVVLIASCAKPEPIREELLYESRSLKIFEISKGLWRHESYLPFEDQDFPCNGLILHEGGQAYVFDTPVYDSVAQELLEFLDLKSIFVKGVIAHHFHNDCLGGLEAFHKRDLPSYALRKTIELAMAATIPVPRNPIDDSLMLQLEQKVVQIFYPGPGHSPDNIVSYFPEYQLLFGGCLIKEYGAGKGYLGDADITAWSQSVKRVQSQFPEVKWLVPGHGAIGDTSLFGYTKKLFQKN